MSEKYSVELTPVMNAQEVRPWYIIVVNVVFMSYFHHLEYVSEHINWFTLPNVYICFYNICRTNGIQWTMPELAWQL